jgi:hypothetical protein
MGAILALLGTTVVAGIASYLSEKGLKISIAIGILILLFVLIPFKLELPQEIYMMFISGKVNQFFKSLTYFLPINFLLSCFLIIFASKYIKIFFNLIKFIWEKFID